MEISMQWNTHLVGYRVAEFVSMARRAFDHGFQAIWLNENARYRDTFVVLSSIAPRFRSRSEQPLWCRIFSVSKQQNSRMKNSKC